MVVKEQDVFDATLVEKTGFSGKHDLTVELGAAPPNDGSHATFLLMGTGTRDKYPTIECTHEASPPPSPPHAADCDLGPTYELVSSWETGEQARIRLERWDDGRVFTLTWYNEKLEVTTNGHNAMPVGTVIKGGDTVARLKLGLREELHIPTDSDGADVLLFEIILKPASKHNPHIVCHEPWPSPPPARSPPPPRPSPPPTASPPPPSPPPGFAADSETCSLGGEMRYLTSYGGGAVVRFEVEPARWEPGAVVSVDFDSGDLEVLGVTSQVTVVSPITSADAATTFSFELGALKAGQPPSFRFNAKGDDIRASGWRCSTADDAADARARQLPPPPPPGEDLEPSPSPEAYYSYADAVAEQQAKLTDAGPTSHAASALLVGGMLLVLGAMPLVACLVFRRRRGGDDDEPDDGDGGGGGGMDMRPNDAARRAARTATRLPEEVEVAGSEL